MADHGGPCSSAADDLFGPVVAGCRRDFDLTLTFEQYIFASTPAALFLVASLARIVSLRYSAELVGSGRTVYFKQTAWLCLALSYFCLVIIYAQDHQLPAWNASVVAYCLCLVAALSALPLSYLEHRRTLHPSYLINGYAIVALLLETAVLRTTWLLNPVSAPLSALHTIMFLVRVLLVILEAWRKTPQRIADEKDTSPEEHSGLYSQSLSWWLVRLIRQGARHILRPVDLYPIDGALASEGLSRQFKHAWTRRGAIHLRSVLLRVLSWPIALAVAPRIALLGLTICQPLLLRRLLGFLQDDSQNSNIGYGIIGAYAVVYLGIAMTSALYWHRHYRFMTMVRGILTTAIYEKTFEVDIAEKNTGKTVTLMSTDVQTIVRGLLDLHELWANTIQIGIATWLIWTQVGVAFVGPLAITALTIIITTGLGKLTSPALMVWIGRIGERIDLTTSILGGMKSIKMTGLQQKVSDLLHDSRRAEMNAAGRFRLISAFTVATATAPIVLSPVLTFAIYIGVSTSGSGIADVTKVFTSLSLIVLMAEPLFNVLASIVDVMSAVGCLQRIHDYLAQTPKKQSHSDEVPSIGPMSTSEDLVPSNPPRSFHGIELLDTIGLPQVPLLRMSNTFIYWSDPEHSILKSISLEVRKGELVILVGPTGAGKSTLLKAMLGEVSMTGETSSRCEGNIAWCEQTPWLQNATIKDNIVAFADWDERWYSSVIHACDLEVDIQNLAKHEMTMIGSKGFSLSGGQKQRIALARAVYARKPLTLLDDVFSQLDMSTQRNIADRLFGANGLLRRDQRATVLATHTEGLLRRADRIIALNAEGQICEQGSFEQLCRTGGFVNRMSANTAQESVVEQTQPGTVPVEQTGQKQDETDDGDKYNDKSRQRGDWSIYGYYLRSLSWSIVLIFTLLQITQACLTTFPYVWLKWWTDSDGSPARNASFIGGYAGLQVGALVLSGLVTFWMFNVMAVSSGMSLHDSLAKAVMTASYPVLHRLDSGEILTRFSQDISLIDIQLPLALMVVVGNTFICLGQIGLMASASGYIAISFPFLLTLFYFVQKYYLRVSRQMRLLDLEEKAPVFTQFTETLDGLTTIRAFGWTAASIRKNHELVDRAQKPFYLLYMVQRWLALVLDMVVGAMAVLIVGVAIALHSRETAGTVSPGFTGVSLTQIITFTSALKLLIMFWTQLETSIGAVVRIRDFARTTVPEDLAGESRHAADLPSNWPAHGALTIQGISASYQTLVTGQCPDDLPKALHDMTLSIRAGEHVAFCGRTGSGKTSLALTWFRLLDTCAGRITLDAIDISTIDRRTLRSRLLFIGDEPFMLPGPASVRDNLVLLPDASAKSDEALDRVLEQTMLAPVVAQAGGLDAPMDTVKLSHGQKQLWNFARALVRSSGRGVVVLDEATSGVDAEAEQVISRLVRTEFRDMTVIAIVHRLEHIGDYDRVGVLDAGRLVEFAPPAELLADTGSALARLVNGGGAS